jgi:uncharacterized protein (DUF58 family)
VVKFRKRQVSLCREGMFYLFLPAFVLTGALLREINLLVLLAGMLFGPLVLSWRIVIVALRGLDLKRSVPRGACAGDLLVVDLEVSNHRRRGASWAVVVTDEIQRLTSADRQEPPIQGEVVFAHIASGETAKAAYRGRLPRRGRYRFGPVRIATRFPLGLIRGSILADLVETVLIYPRLGRLERGWLDLHRDAVMGSRRTQRKHGLMEGEFHGLRDWRQGDSRRWIHWRTTARRGNLSVLQFEQPRNQDLVLVVELWQPPRATATERDTVELAVSFVTTIVVDACRRGGSHVSLSLGGQGRQSVSGAASMALQMEALEALSVAEATDQDQLPALLDAAYADARKGAQVVVVSTRPTDLSDANRFAGLHRDSARARVVGWPLCIDASNSELDRYFRPE